MIEEKDRRRLSVLIVEDVDHKFSEVEAALQLAVNQSIAVTRAKTLVEADQFVRDGQWDLVVLDISMDIAPGSSGSAREGHANLGGMDVIEQMFLIEKESPTVIVTGFDYFIRAGSSDHQDAQTFSDLEKKARSFIGGSLLGCVRYGAPNWEDAFTHCLEKL
jgi:CheY-like chemotaxis protein